MSTLTAEQRGDLAEDMLPVAANLAVLVHGEGGPEDVQGVLGGLSGEQRDALIVVLAGLVDPDQSLGKALGWLDFTEDGALTVPYWGEDRPVRDLVAADDVEGCSGDDVDRVAVQRFVDGAEVTVSDAEFLVALGRCRARGMTNAQVDNLRRVQKGTTEKTVNRLRKAYTRSGRALPVVLRPVGADVLTAEQVVRIRERSAAGGVTDLELAMAYGVTQQTISRLCVGASWRKAGGPIRARRGSKPSAEQRVVWAGGTPA
jgi:hypothetical protein